MVQNQPSCGPDMAAPAALHTRLPLDRVENFMKTDPDLNGFAHLCNVIKFRSPGHMSLSFAGLLFVLVVKVVLAVLSYADVGVKKLRPNLLLQWERSGYLYIFGYGEKGDQGTATLVFVEARLLTIISVDQTHGSKVHLYERDDGSKSQTAPLA